jgi:hypothetical protein
MIWEGAMKDYLIAFKNWVWTGARLMPRDEAARRLADYHLEATTGELYSFGKLLLDEGIQRTGQLESKATIVVGYSGALIAFLLTQPATKNSLVWWATIVGAACALVALALAFWAGRIHRAYWLSDRTWLPDRKIAKAFTLQLHYFEAIFEVTQDLRSLNLRKGNLVFLAQWTLLSAVVAVTVALFASR